MELFLGSTGMWIASEGEFDDDVMIQLVLLYTVMNMYLLPTGTYYSHSS